MACFFSSIRNFSHELVIEGYEEKGGGSSVVSGKASIHCYSLTVKQKVAAITLCALAIITLIIGAASLGGANIIGTTAAWAMVGTGLGVSMSIVSFMTVNHLLFIRRVSKFLNNQYKNCFDDWKEAKNYPGPDYRWRESKTKPAFSYNDVGQKFLYGKRYVQCESAFAKFYIEFHRTLSIQRERGIF